MTDPVTRPPRTSLAREVAAYVFAGKRLWLVPLVLLLILVALLAATGALAPYASFLYPL